MSRFFLRTVLILIGLLSVQATPRLVRSTQALLPVLPGDQPANPNAKTISVFANGAASIVARTVGHAEGTRTANGDKTRAYYGHVDPGNGVWNLGSFSYQHGARSTEDADVAQLRRLQTQTATMLQIARAIGISLSLAEKLNAIDLANQSPLAALGTRGYIERLQQAKRQGLQGAAAILWARTWSYRHPTADRWDAAGLGNTEANIRHDQERRMLAIAAALASYRQQYPSVQPVSYSPEQAYYNCLINVVLKEPVR